MTSDIEPGLREHVRDVLTPRRGSTITLSTTMSGQAMLILESPGRGRGIPRRHFAVVALTYTDAFRVLSEILEN